MFTCYVPVVLYIVSFNGMGQLTLDITAPLVHKTISFRL